MVETLENIYAIMKHTPDFQCARSAPHQPQGRARHSVRAAARLCSSERRARSDAPYHGARVRETIREPGRLGQSLAGLALVGALLVGGVMDAPAQSVPPKEYQVKAAFLYNFAQFVEWPPVVFPEVQSPLVIGVLGDDPFGGYLDDLVREEKVNGRPLVVQRYHTIVEIKTCHVLFICQSEIDQLEQILAGLKGRNILTVGDGERFASRGGMIRFVTEQNRIRLRINVEAAKVANLTISSKLLRLAEIVRPGKD